MAQYPPPPAPDQHHYNAIYPVAANAQPLQFQYGDMSQAIYPKAQPGPGPDGHATPAQQAQQAQHIAQQMQQQQAAHIQQQINSQAQAQRAENSQATETTAKDGTPKQRPKIVRLSKACDGCSVRKIKCDETGPPCRACKQLNLPCTFSRPIRRRGPRNRMAETIKRTTLESLSDPFAFDRDMSPTDPNDAAEALAELSSRNARPTVESMCSVSKMDALIDDFFTYVHPLYPFPHEPSFREAWKRREDLNNPAFLALLASMIGALVASFPRKARLHLTARRRSTTFPQDLDLVRRCQSVCAVARGPGYLENATLSVYDAAASYFLGLTGLYTQNWRQARLYLGECLTIIRVLGLHKEDTQSQTALGAFPASLGFHSLGADGTPGQHVDLITLEMGRRIFWTLFVTVKSMQQYGADFDELSIPPATPSSPHPPLPAEIDDFCIFPTYTEQQPEGYLSLITGFNANVAVFRTYDDLATVDIAWGKDSLVERQRQMRLLRATLRARKECLATLPPELRVAANAEGQNGYHLNGVNGDAPDLSLPNVQRDPAFSLIGDPQSEAVDENPEQRRQVQRAAQQENIYASVLSTRLYLVRKLARINSPEAQLDLVKDGILAAGLDRLASDLPTNISDDGDQLLREERDSVSVDILRALSSIEDVNMAPNADNSTAKIRALGLVLLNLPETHQSPLVIRAKEPLAGFLQGLIQAENTTSEADGTLPGAQDKQDGFWTELLAHRTRLADLAAQSTVD